MFGGVVSASIWMSITGQHQLSWKLNGSVLVLWAAGRLKACASVYFCNNCFPVFWSVVFIPEWHQYDDIVCVESSAIRNFVHSFMGGRNKDVVKGKVIAANTMLESIFSILGTWSPENLSSFLAQLQQFYVVTEEQLVHDSFPTSWRELNFGRQEVSHFLLTETRAQTLSSQTQNFYLVLVLLGSFYFSSQSSGATEPVGILLGSLPLSALGTSVTFLLLGAILRIPYWSAAGL